MQTVQDYRDGIETAILLGLGAARRNTGIKKQVERRGRSHIEVFDLGMFCPKKPEHPSDVFVLDPAADDRIYSASLDDIVVDPVSAIGRGLETGMICADGSFKWTKISPMPAPRGLVAVSNRPVRWFCYQFREIREGVKDEYLKRPLPLVDGRVPLMKCSIGQGFNARREIAELEEQLAISLSVFEDAMRANAYLATVEECTKIRFPVGETAYKEFFALRDGHRDTPTGRRNPILHWCSKHLRSRGETVFEVTGHDRGAVSMTVGPLRLSIERGRGYSALIPEQNGSGT